MDLKSLESGSPVAIPGSDVRVLFGAGVLAGIGEHAKGLGRRVLLVTDKGIREAGHVERAVRSLYAADLPVRVFDEVIENPTTVCVGKGVRAAASFMPDLIIGLGGGSAMDTAKGINFILTNGGSMADYHGAGKATKPMLPLIAVPTTAGTGSEAQSYALISDPETHTKMACGDKKALPKLAILDPELVGTCPAQVAAATGIDAVAHAVETAASTRRTPASREFSKQAWSLLEPSFSSALGNGSTAARDARARMLLGAHLAGAAIENSMLGAAHATANPLTAKFDITHGVAVGLMLPHVVRFNTAGGESPYSDLVADADELVCRIDRLLAAAGLPRRLAELNVPEAVLPELAALASRQWTASFNPRPVGEAELYEIYRRAL
jgi:alcohol dehydrogenase